MAETTKGVSALLATRSLQIQLPVLRWEVEMPKVQPGGDAIRANLTAKVQTPAAGEPITVIGTNSRATAYTA